MRRTRHETGPTLRRPSRAAATLFALATIVAACSAPGAGTTTPPPAGSAPSIPPATMPGAGLTLELATVPTHGSIVVGDGGMSLYLFLSDTDGQGTCVEGCAAAWPPLTVAAAGDVVAGSGITGEVGTIARADGTTQVTLGGAPLYYFASDTAAGDTNGQGVGGVWYLVSAAGEPVGQAAASPDGGEPTATICAGRSCY